MTAGPAATSPRPFPVRLGAAPAGGLAPTRLVLVSVLAAAATATLLAGGLRPLEVREQLVLAVATVTLLALAGLVLVTGLRGVEQGIARWRIGPWFLLWTGFSLGLASITWLVPQTGIASRIALPSVVQALTIAAVAIVMWTLGYCLGVPGVVRGFAGRAIRVLLRGGTATIGSGPMPWVVYGIGTAARVTYVALSGQFGYVGDPRGLLSYAAPYANVLHIVSSFTLFAIAAAAYRAFDTRTRGGWLTLLALVVVEAIAGALAGGKQYFILTVLAVLIPYCAVRGRMSARLLIVAGLAFLLVFVPFNVAYREYVRDQQSFLPVSDAVRGAPELASSTVDDGSPGATVLASSEQMFYRVRQSDGLAIVVQRTPATIPFRNPAELAYAPFVGMIPRAVWPDKPVLASGYDFSQEYYGLPSTVYSSSGITPLGDLYRHGGWPTVVVGMLLLGMGCRLFDTLIRLEVDPRAVCFLLVFLPIIGRTGAHDLLVALPTGILTAVVGARLICRPTRRTEATA